MHEKNSKVFFYLEGKLASMEADGALRSRVYDDDDDDCIINKIVRRCRIHTTRVVRFVDRILKEPVTQNQEEDFCTQELHIKGSHRVTERAFTRRGFTRRGVIGRGVIGRGVTPRDVTRRGVS